MKYSMRTFEKLRDEEIISTLKKKGMNIGVIFQEPFVYPCGVDPAFKENSKLCPYPGPGMAVEFTNTICDRLGIICRYVAQNITDDSRDTHQELANRILFNDGNTMPLDTALPILVQTLNFRHNLEFTMPVFYMEHGLLIKTRFLVNNDEFYFPFKPFHWSVWTILILSILSVSLLDGFFRFFWTSAAERKKNGTYFMQAESSWLMTFGILLSRGIDIPIHHFSRRVLLVTWGLACIIICNVYSAQLVSTKVAQKIQQPFTNLKELADKLLTKEYRMLIYSPDSKFIHDIVDAPQGPYSYLRDALNVNPPSYLNNLTNITSKISDSKENLVLYASQFTMKAISQNNCNLTIIKLSVTDFGSFAFKPNNSYAELFTKVILNFKEKGYYMEKLEQKYSYGRNCESRLELNAATDKEEMQTVEIANLQIIFWVLLMGCVVAALGFGLEVAYHRIYTDYVVEEVKLKEETNRKKSKLSQTSQNSIYDGLFLPNSYASNLV